MNQSQAQLIIGELLKLVFALVLPMLVSYLKRQSWPAWRVTVLAIVVSLPLGAASEYVQGTLDWSNVTGAVGVIVTGAIVIYQKWFKWTDFNRTLEQLQPLLVLLGGQRPLPAPSGELVPVPGAPLVYNSPGTWQGQEVRVEHHEPCEVPGHDLELMHHTGTPNTIDGQTTRYLMCSVCGGIAELPPGSEVPDGNL